MGPFGPPRSRGSKECPQSFQKVFQTLWGHSRDTFWTRWSLGPEAPQGHPVGHSLGHLRVRGHSDLPWHVGQKEQPTHWENGQYPRIGNENSARSFSDRSLLSPAWGHGRPRLRAMDVRTEMLGFQDFQGLTEVFAPGRPPGYARGRPRDIRPRNPDLPFLAFVETGKENLPKNKDFYPWRTPKIPGKEGKNAEKSKEFLGKEKIGDRDRGVKSLKIRGGVKIFNFQGPLKLTPFYRDSKENRKFRGQKSKFSRGNFRGEFTPPSSVRYVLTPLSRSPKKARNSKKARKGRSGNLLFGLLVRS